MQDIDKLFQEIVTRYQFYQHKPCDKNMALLAEACQDLEEAIDDSLSKPEPDCEE